MTVKSIIKFLNNITLTTRKYLRDTNSRFRTKKITLKDVLYSRFLYTSKEKTKENITSLINHNKKNNFIERTCLYRKDKNISYGAFKNIFLKLKDFVYNGSGNSLNFIAVDGTYNNTNHNHNGSLETSMNLGFYDIYNGLPLDLHFTGVGKKNNELICLKKYINENLDLFVNKTVICDRAYFCYDFFLYLMESNINFVIRFKKNSLLLKDAHNSKNKKHKPFFDLLKENKLRIIIKKTDKEDVYLITNLKKDVYDDVHVIDIYCKRWDIEVFFGHLKKNFKFQHFDEYALDCYYKNIYSELSILLIKKLLIDVYKKENNSSFKIKNNDLTIKKKINESLLITGIYDHLLEKIFNGTIKKKDINMILKTYITVSINKNERQFDRKSKKPFSKWYVKSYHKPHKQLRVKMNKLIQLEKKEKKKIYFDQKIELRELKKYYKNNILNST